MNLEGKKIILCFEAVMNNSTIIVTQVITIVVDP